MDARAILGSMKGNEKYGNSLTDKEKSTPGPRLAIDVYHSRRMDGQIKNLYICWSTSLTASLSYHVIK
jgi:hypothetical protein